MVVVYVPAAACRGGGAARPAGANSGSSGLPFHETSVYKLVDCQRAPAAPRNVLAQRPVRLDRDGLVVARAPGTGAGRKLAQNRDPCKKFLGNSKPERRKQHAIAALTQCTCTHARSAAPHRYIAKRAAHKPKNMLSSTWVDAEP